MTTWVVGDIHGCAEELAELVGRLQLGEEDRLLSVGDLFHRGPDAAGVMDVLVEAGAEFLLGNHEVAVLRRTRLAPSRVDGSDRPPLRESFPPLTVDDLAGDGGRALNAPPERLADILVFLQRHRGYYVHGDDYDPPSRSAHGGGWCAVHAGLRPGSDPHRSPLEDLVYPPRLGWGRRRKPWHAQWRGPDLVLYGHVPRPEPVESYHGDRREALGLDTGCVYGGSLTAYSPERDEFVRVAARRAWATR